ncbi:MAG: hypothetical protein AAF567_24075 [Actinomycetota bacterium]
MILAELEVYHSRPIAPTRRVAIGHSVLPIDDSPGFGGLLLGGIVARYSKELDEELCEELEILSYQVEQGQRIPQPRLRHRLQEDRIGLSRSVHRLERLPNNRLHLAFEEKHEAPAQYVLAAVYVAGRLAPRPRGDVMKVIRRAIGWQGDAANDDVLLGHLSSSYSRFALSSSSQADPVAWAMEVVGLDPDADMPGQDDLRKRIRTKLREAHPDVSGASEDAADRIAELTEARRILLA